MPAYAATSQPSAVRRSVQVARRSRAAGSSAHDAGDLVQETLLRAWRSFGCR